jgi:hypothetical protein
MRLRSSVFSVVGSAALALLAGCVTTQQVPPDGTTPPPPKEEPVKPPPQPEPSAGTSPWQRARVGDRVAYTFSTNQTPVRGGPGQPRALAGRLSVEVVAVQQPWVWLKLGFSDEKGQPLSNPRLAREMLVPVSTETSRPLEVPREGTESVEQPSAAGRTWEAKRYIRDNRPADGPLENRLYAVSPGPLYLTNGLLDASTTLSGFGASGGTQLTLVEAQQGAEGAATMAVPTLERPLGPGTWYDLRSSMPGNDTTQRTCFSAERGYVLRAAGPVPAAGSAPCPSFTEAEVVPLEESLLGLISEAVGASGPAAGATPTSRGTFSAAGRGIPSITFETPETEGQTRKVRYETYAADPWDASLAGLPYEARFRPLTEGVDKLGKKNARESEASTKLSAWGTWVGDAK